MGKLFQKHLWLSSQTLLMRKVFMLSQVGRPIKCDAGACVHEGSEKLPRPSSKLCGSMNQSFNRSLHGYNDV